MDWKKLLKMFDLAAPKARRAGLPAPPYAAAPLGGVPPGPPVAKEYAEPELSPLGRLAIKFDQASKTFYGAGGTSPVLGGLSGLARVAALVAGQPVQEWEKWKKASETSPVPELVQPPPLSAPPPPLPGPFAAPPASPAVPSTAPPATPKGTPATPAPTRSSPSPSIATFTPSSPSSPVIVSGPMAVGGPPVPAFTGSPIVSPPATLAPVAPQATLETSPKLPVAIPPAVSPGSAKPSVPVSPAPQSQRLTTLIPQILATPGARKFGLTVEILRQMAPAAVFGMARQLGILPSSALPSPGVAPSLVAASAAVTNDLPSPATATSTSAPTPFPPSLKAGLVPPSSAPPWTAGGVPVSASAGLGAAAPSYGPAIGSPIAPGQQSDPILRDILGVLREILREMQSQKTGNGSGEEADEAETEENRRPLWKKIIDEGPHETPRSTTSILGGIDSSPPLVMRPPMPQNPEHFKV